MSITAWAQLALGLVQIVNWIMTKIDQNEWKRLGYAEAMADQLRLLNSRVEGMRVIRNETEARAEAEIDKDLME